MPASQFSQLEKTTDGPPTTPGVSLLENQVLTQTNEPQDDLVFEDEPARQFSLGEGPVAASETSLTQNSAPSESGDESSASQESAKSTKRAPRRLKGTLTSDFNPSQVATLPYNSGVDAYNSVSSKAVEKLLPAVHSMFQRHIVGFRDSQLLLRKDMKLLARVNQENFTPKSLIKGFKVTARDHLMENMKPKLDQLQEKVDEAFEKLRETVRQQLRSKTEMEVKDSQKQVQIHFVMMFWLSASYTVGLSSLLDGISNPKDRIGLIRDAMINTLETYCESAEAPMLKYSCIEFESLHKVFHEVLKAEITECPWSFEVYKPGSISMEARTRTLPMTKAITDLVAQCIVNPWANYIQIERVLERQRSTVLLLQSEAAHSATAKLAEDLGNPSQVARSVEDIAAATTKGILHKERKKAFSKKQQRKHEQGKGKKPSGQPKKAAVKVHWGANVDGAPSTNKKVPPPRKPSNKKKPNKTRNNSAEVKSKDSASASRKRSLPTSETGTSKDGKDPVEQKRKKGNNGWWRKKRKDKKK